MSTLTRTVLETTSGLAAQPVSASAINLTWTANPRATGYRVYRNGTLIGSPTAASYGDTGLSASTSYTYTVAVVAASGEGPQTAGVQGTTLAAPDTTAPTAPVITATATSQNTISVALTTPATDAQSGVASYDLEYKRAVDATYTVITPVTAGQFPYIIGSLTQGTQHNTRARARDTVGNIGAYSAVSNATTQAASGTGNALYSGLDMALVPYHNGAGGWGAQLPFQTAALPNITRSANVANFSQLQAECSTPGTRITLTANIVGGNVTGNMTDIEIVVPFGRLLSNVVFGTFNGSNVHTRLRFTKASGDTIGGQVHWVQFFGAQGRDIIADGLQLSVGTADPGIPFYLNHADLERVAILRNRIKSENAGFGYGCPHLLIAGNSMLHNSNATGNGGDWGYRISTAGASIFFENDTRVPDNTPNGQAYAPLRYHPRNGSALQYAWASGSTFVNLAEGRTFDCNDTGGSSAYPNNIDAVWMLNSRFYVANGFFQFNTRGSPASGPAVDYFRINGNQLFGSTGPFSTGGAPNGDATGNTYSAALGTVPAWGAAGDPTGINTAP